MSVETGLDPCVPDTLKIPPSEGAPIWKLSIELFLSIAERLDSATCLTFSQTCRTLSILSKERSVYWRNASFAHGLLPRIAPMSSFTGAELRSTAIKGINLEWKWEDTSPVIVKRVPVRIHLRKERYWIPDGSRWLFQYGAHAHLRVPSVLIYDMVTGRHIGESRMPQADKIDRIVGQSLSPDMVAFAVQFQNTLHVAICTATFHENDGIVGKQIIDTVDRLPVDMEVTSCVFQDGIIGVTTAEAVIIQQWDNSATRWKLDAGFGWIPRGLQVARDRLLVLEVQTSGEEIKKWRIRVFDISLVRSGVAQRTLEDQIRQLRFIDSVDILHAPVVPFYAPYYVDRTGDPGVHLGFKILLLIHTGIGENLWHWDLRLDTEMNEKGELEELLVVDSSGPYIVGIKPDERPTQFLDGFAMGPKASRIVWTSENGVTRIRSDWKMSDEASGSRLLNMRSVPMSIPRLLAFDEMFGVVLQSDTLTHNSLSYFI